VKTVDLSQMPQLYNVQRVGDHQAIITLYDNVVEQQTEEDEGLKFTADKYQARVIWRDGLDDPALYDEWLARLKELEDPQEVKDKRIAREILL
jgi:hypothetical protein